MKRGLSPGYPIGTGYSGETENMIHTLHRSNIPQLKKQEADGEEINKHDGLREGKKVDSSDIVLTYRQRH